MEKKLRITLSETATRAYLEWSRDITRAEVDEGCEPSGRTISIDIEPSMYDSSAYVMHKGEYLDFGTVEIDWV